MMKLFQSRHQVVSSKNKKTNKRSEANPQEHPQEHPQPPIVLGADDSETSLPDEEISDELGLKIWGTNGGFTVHPKIATGTNPHPNPQRKTYESTLERVDSERMLESSNPQQEARDNALDAEAIRRQAATFLQVLESGILPKSPSVCEESKQHRRLKPCLKRRSAYGPPECHHSSTTQNNNSSTTSTNDDDPTLSNPQNPREESAPSRDAPPRNRSNEQHIEEMAQMVDEPDDDDSISNDDDPPTTAAAPPQDKMELSPTSDTTNSEDDDTPPTEQQQPSSKQPADPEPEQQSPATTTKARTQSPLQRGRNRRVRFATNPANHHRVWCLTQTFPPVPSNIKHKLWWSSRHLRQLFEQHYDDLDAEIEDDYGYALQEAYASVSHTNHSNNALLHLGTFVRCSAARGLEKCCYDVPDHIQRHKEAILDTQAMMKQDEWVGGMDSDTIMDILRFRSVKFAHPCCQVALKLGQYDHILLSLDTGDEELGVDYDSDDGIPEEARNDSRWNASSRRGVDLSAVNSEDDESDHEGAFDQEEVGGGDVASDSETTVLDDDFQLIFESEDEGDSDSGANSK